MRTRGAHAHSIHDSLAYRAMRARLCVSRPCVLRLASPLGCLQRCVRVPWYQVGKIGSALEVLLPREYVEYDVWQANWQASTGKGQSDTRHVVEPGLSVHSHTSKRRESDSRPDDVLGVPRDESSLPQSAVAVEGSFILPYETGDAASAANGAIGGGVDHAARMEEKRTDVPDEGWTVSMADVKCYESWVNLQELHLH